LRRSRYMGISKTCLQHLATAAAINLERVSDWLGGIGRERTRGSAFARVMQPLTAQSLIALIMEESSPCESQPQALAEPYVNLSVHTAPITQAADRKPNRQCANKPGACFAMRPSQVLAQDLWRLDRLYFLTAHLTR